MFPLRRLGYSNLSFSILPPFPVRSTRRGWSGSAMVLGKLLVPGRPTIWISVGQGPTVLAVGAGGGCLDIFTLIYSFSPLSPSLWETARYRLKYCLKGPLNPKQPTNQLGQLVRENTYLLISVRIRNSYYFLYSLETGAGGGCLDIFTLIYSFSPLSPSLWETARYRLKYCLKGPLNPKQPTN